jgi:cell division septum initiation protein DivIVA
MRLKNPVSDPDIDLDISGALDLGDITRVYPLEDNESLSGIIEADVKLKGKLSDVEEGNYRAVQATGYILMNDVIYRSGFSYLPLEVANAQINVSPAYLDIVSLDALLGESDFQLTGKVEEYLLYYFNDGKLKGNLVLKGGNINLNELMASGPGEEYAGSAAGSNLPDTASLSSFLIPSYLDLVLNTSINALLYNTIEMKNVKGIIEIADRKLILKGLTLEMFGGGMLLNGMYATADPSAPEIDFVLGVTGADIGEMVSHIPVMERFAPVASKVMGELTGEINLASVLDANMMPLYETVKGIGNLKTGSLRIAGVNSLNALSNALQMESLKTFELDPLNLSFQLMEGKMNVKPFDMKSGNIAMNLGGWTSVSKEIGYDLLLKIPRQAFSGGANDALNNLVDAAKQKGADIQLGDMVELKTLISGTLDDPKLSLGLAGKGKGIIEDVKEEIKEVVETKLDEEATKILQEAQARADAIMKKAQEEADKVMAGANKLAEETRSQANLNAAKLEKEAEGKGSLAKMAAKKAADEVRKEGDNQAKNIISEAEKQRDSILQKAKQESDKIMQEAKNKVAALNK